MIASFKDSIKTIAAENVLLHLDENQDFVILYGRKCWKNDAKPSMVCWWNIKCFPLIYCLMKTKTECIINIVMEKKFDIPERATLLLDFGKGSSNAFVIPEMVFQRCHFHFCKERYWVIWRRKVCTWSMEMIQI